MLALQRQTRSRIARDRRQRDQLRHGAIHLVWADAWNEELDEPLTGGQCCGTVSTSGPGGGIAEAIALAADVARDMKAQGVPGRIYLTDGLGHQLDVSRTWESSTLDTGGSP